MLGEGVEDMRRTERLVSKGTSWGRAVPQARVCR